MRKLATPLAAAVMMLGIVQPSVSSRTDMASSQDLTDCAASQGVAIRKGDFVIVRTGQLEERIYENGWGAYARGAAPELRLETAEWIHRKQIAPVCTDNWGCEVQPKETTDTNQPWHWVVRAPDTPN